MSRLGRGFPNNALLRILPPRPPSWLATGSGANGTASPVTLNDTIPAGTTCTLIWVANSATAVPTISAKVGSTSATLINTTLVSTYGADIYITCFALIGPPTGAQTITFTTTAPYQIVLDTVHYTNVASIGTPVTLGGQTSAQALISITNTNPNTIYANAFTYQTGGAGPTFSGYNQTQRYIAAGSANTYPVVIGDAYGNGGTLTFSANRSQTTYDWGGIIVPLMPI